jgi:thiamine-monophosphate kinase
MAEFEYIRWVRERVRSSDRVRVGIGDDCAILDVPDPRVLVTTDMLMDGVHFVLADAGPRRVGRKALAVNLSDIASMGGRPLAAVVSVALPRRGTQQLAEELLRGMETLAEEFACPLIGGDTNTWNGPLVLSLTVLGEPGPCGPILRSGAKPGDWLLVTGSLGGSLAGKHLDFTPRVREALELQKHCTPRAMIDLSDGLAGDVGHLCDESHCGAILAADAIPIDAAVQADRQTPLEHALRDGEDFELAIAVAPEDGNRLMREQPLPGVRLTRVGDFRAELGLWLDEGGKRRRLEPRGYEHPFEET